MDPKVAGLVRVFDSLSPQERQEAVEKLNEYINGDTWTKRQIVEEGERVRIAKRMDLGPVGRVCPYCGR